MKNGVYYNLIVAIFGGSFEPPHIGHEEIAKVAIESLGIDKLFVIPTFLNPFKKTININSEIKLFWLQKVFKKYKKVEVLDYEIKQQKQVSTIQTVEYIIQKYSPSHIYLIIGADNLSSLHMWNKFEKLEKKVEFVVASRDDICIDSKFKTLLVKMSISSSSLRNNLDLDFIPDVIKKDVKEYYEK